jgi:hypothetical protein
LIMFDRSFLKWWQFSKKCSGVWTKLQFPLHLFVS